jgi:hypothetical protein
MRINMVRSRRIFSPPSSKLLRYTDFQAAMVSHTRTTTITRMSVTLSSTVTFVNLGKLGHLDRLDGV